MGKIRLKWALFRYLPAKTKENLWKSGFSP
jgi:hypothetical protein